jgi:hypothetical protein
MIQFSKVRRKTKFFVFNFRIKLSKPIPDSELDTFVLETFAEHENKLTFMIARFDPKRDISGKGSSVSFHFLDEDLVRYQYSLQFQRNNYFNKYFIDKVDQLISGGITQKFVDDQLYRKLDVNDEQKAQPLTFEHLDLCFAAIMICLGLCCVVFAIEWIVGRKKWPSTVEQRPLPQSPLFFELPQ